MIESSISNYYVFGTESRFLLDARVESPIKGDGMILENVGRFLKNLDTLGLPVTATASFRLRDFKAKLEKATQDELDDDLAHELGEIMSEIRLTLHAEISGLKAFVATPKRLGLEALQKRVDSLFAPKVYESFSEIAKFDFAQAGKCVAFELPTAAAFHILRGTEANLRHYYRSMIKQRRIASEMWGPIVQDLRIRPKTKVHTVLNTHLDHIRGSFRNPTQHPDATYDIHEVQDLFALCADVNNRMFKILSAQ